METMNTETPLQFYTNEEKQFAMFIHFAQFAAYISFGLGWIIPLVLWQMKKDSSPYIDAHGKIVMNWIISSIIYGVVCGMFVFLVIGIPLLLALAVCSIIFPIMGGIKANNGETWVYPLSITFIS